MRSFFGSDFFSKKISSPEIFLVACLVIFGLLALLWLPIGAGYDEETHFVHAWQLSVLDVLPNREGEGQLPYPKVYWDLSYRRQELVRLLKRGSGKSMESCR